MFWEIATFWLKCSLQVFLGWSLWMYIDQDRQRMRDHSKTWWMVVLKLTFAPVTMLYVGAMVLTALPRFWWNMRQVGCFANNRQPACPPGMSRRDRLRANKQAVEAEHAADVLNSITEGAEAINRHAAKKNANASCSAGVVRASLEMQRGSHSVVNEEALDECDEYVGMGVN